MTGTQPFVNIELLEAGAIWHVTFGASKGNVLDAGLVAELTAVFHRAATDKDLKARQATIRFPGSLRR